MSTDRHLPRPALRRCIEETIAAEPGGITTRELRATLALRARALGESPAGPHQLVRQLGQLLVEGRVDECDGVWVLLEDSPLAQDPRTRNQAA
jgi:hypothetical protein